MFLKVLKQRWPQAATFAAATNAWWSEAEQTWKRRPGNSQLAQSEASKLDINGQQQRDADRARRKKLLAEWNGLTNQEQDEIRSAVYTSSNATVRKFLDEGKINDTLVMFACLRELGRISEARSE